MIFKQLFTQENKKCPGFHITHIISKKKINVIKKYGKNTIPNLKKYQERLKKINIAQSAQEVKLQHKGTMLRKYTYTLQLNIIVIQLLL